MKCPLLGVALLVGCWIAAAGQQPSVLHNGQQITLRGTLVMRPGGRLQFAAVATAGAYITRDMSRMQTAIHELGLSGYNRYDMLYAHRGQAVTVRGTVITNDASPYYLRGASVKVSSIRLANGTDVMGSPHATGHIAVDVGQYRASVVLPADLAQPWQYSAHGAPDTEQQFLSCGSNGGGDVVNCSCAQGFHALHAESSTRGVSTHVFGESQTAQFGVGEQARRVELSVTCSR